MPTKGTIRIKEKGQIVPYYPVTSYDSVVNEAGSNLKIHIAELDSFKDTASKKLAGIADNATRTEKSSTNGNIRINGVETVVYTHPSTSGNKHIPAGGSVGQILKWKSDGTAEWAAETNTEYDVATKDRNGLMSSTDKTKLDGIAAGANNYIHPSTPGNKHIPAGGTPGQVLKYSADGTAQWAAETDTKYSVATQKNDGLMSSTDKTKLDGIAPNANNYVHPSGSGNNHIPRGGTLGQILKYTADGEAKWDNEIIYEPASTTTSGLMSAADKKKLDGIANNATNYVHPNTPGNKHIPSGGFSGQILRYSSDGTAEWSDEMNTEYELATVSRNGLMSSTDKTKLDGIAHNANNYIHPTSTGNRHIPSGGSSGQILQWAADGQAKWVNYQPASSDASSIGGLTADNIHRVIDLAGSQNANDYRKTGTYYCDQWKNGPAVGKITRGCIIVTNEGISNNTSFQTFINSTTGERWNRHSVSGQWKQWLRDPSYSKYLKSGDDLNNILEAGTYILDSDYYDSTSVLNTPKDLSWGFVLNVFENDSITQMLIDTDPNGPRIFIRCSMGNLITGPSNSWTEWFDVATGSTNFKTGSNGNVFGGGHGYNGGSWDTLKNAYDNANIRLSDESETSWCGIGVDNYNAFIVRQGGEGDTNPISFKIRKKSMQFFDEEVHSASSINTRIDNVDLNTLCSRTGVYAGTARANHPPSLYSQIYVDVKVYIENNSVLQTVWSINEQGVSWTRLMQNGRWTEWVNTSAPIIKQSEPSGYSHGQVWIQY